ncbi:MAG TPA: DUF6599 family protein [Pontiella sp.]
MAYRILLTAGWLFPLLVLLLFFVKGQFYNPAVFTPPFSEVTALPVPVSIEGWLLEEGIALPAGRMFEKINGKADYYLQYGAVELSSGEWVAAGQRWDMYLYRFETEQGAKGAYNGEKPSAVRPIDGVEGYVLPGQAAMTVGPYYLQLIALSAGADSAPAVKLSMALIPYLNEGGEAAAAKPQIDLVTLAGGDIVGDSEGFIPESAFGFSAFSNVRTVDVSLNHVETVWFAGEGNGDTVSAYAKELSLYGGEQLFTQENASGGSMFGSWSIAGVVNGMVWGVQNAPSKEALLQHWSILCERLNTGAESP